MRRLPTVSTHCAGLQVHQSEWHRETGSWTVPKIRFNEVKPTTTPLILPLINPKDNNNNKTAAGNNNSAVVTRSNNNAGMGSRLLFLVVVVVVITVVVVVVVVVVMTVHVVVFIFFVLAVVVADIEPRLLNNREREFYH